MSLITVARECDLRIAIPAHARFYRTLFLDTSCDPALLAVLTGEVVSARTWAVGVQRFFFI
jgi:hypothetical protein